MGLNRTSSNSCRIDGDVLIDALSHDGRGLGRHRGKALFVEGALKGEMVRVQITETRRRYINARATELVTRSPERCDPQCAHFARCGGCSLQYWSHEGQISGKQAIALDQLSRFSGVEPQMLAEPLVSSPYGYRFRCRLAIRWKKGRLHLGFREKGSQAICTIHECPVLAEPLQSLPLQLQTLLPALRAREAITHGECFLADNGRAVLLRHIRPLSEPDRQKLLTYAEQESLYLFLQSGPDQVECLYAPDPENRSGRLYYRLPESSVVLHFRPLDFTQVNRPVNRAMVEQALDWLSLERDARVLDLFCGLGNFSLPLARQSGQVVGVEGSENSVNQARANALLNKIENTEFHAADLSSDLRHQSWFHQHYDALLLDPPRTGAEAVIRQLAEALPDRLLYISCNPATLARDAGILASYGFVLERLGVMDMFPQTAHVESMALFTR